MRLIVVAKVMIYSDFINQTEWLYINNNMTNLVVVIFSVMFETLS